ncbi:hypothetical protein BG004_003265, partial [Podila humilis]
LLAAADGNFQVSAPDILRGNATPKEMLGNMAGMLEWLAAYGNFEQHHMNDGMAAVEDLRRIGRNLWILLGSCDGRQKCF